MLNHLAFKYALNKIDQDINKFILLAIENNGLLLKYFNNKTYNIVLHRSLNPIKPL